LTVCQFCGTRLMDNAKYCYKCERELAYPGASVQPGILSLGESSTNGISDAAGIHVLGECGVCKRPVTIQNPVLKCNGCQKEFCLACEEEFRECREPGEKSFCKQCFPQYQDLIRRLSLETYVPK